MAQRIDSLDQFRGYTVLGMFVVNFLGNFRATPALLKHHDTYCSYADTIMPAFFFAVGFAYRLTFLQRRVEAGGVGAGWRFWQRNLRLIAFGALIYLLPAAVQAMTRNHPPPLAKFLSFAFQEELFQTLVHIGVTALWLLPVIGRGPVARLGWACGSAGIHVGLSHWFYYDFVNRLGIDGGMLGFLTWTLPMVAGTLAHDIVTQHPERNLAAGRLLLWGAAVMLLGYGLSCLNRFTPPNAPTPGQISSWFVEPPFVPPTKPVNLWTMSQRAGSVSYLTFGAGLALTLYALFVWAFDGRRFQFGIWRTLGTNALAAYVIHILIGFAFEPWLPRRVPMITAIAFLMLFLAACYLCVWLLEKRKLYWRM